MANLSDYDLFIVTQGLIDQDTNHRISVFKAVKYVKTETTIVSNVNFLERAVLALQRPCNRKILC